MAKQNIDESVQALKHLTGPDPLERVYLFYGEDCYMMDKLVDALEAKRFKGKKSDPLSWEVYRADETEAQKALESVRTFSMFGGAKVVIYRDIEKLPEADLQKIAEYTKSPAKAHLVLLAGKIDSRKKSWSEIKKNAYCANCAPLSDRNVVDYIRTTAKNLKLGPSAAEALANSIGPNRALIERAIEKLTLAIPEGQTITPEIVEEHVIDTRERSIFELTKSLTKRDIPSALNALRILIDQKQEPVVINGMLARHARMMLQVKLGQAQNLSESDIAQKAGINPYAMREYLEAARNYSLGELYQFHADVYETDRALKSKPVPPVLVLSKLIMKLQKTSAT
ncbi:MAG: DNA polymerase III subunit delta [Proteobacteria bacterium]|nr:DNA polymerase III subunit delta [Pseudomonadota bacterium]